MAVAYLLPKHVIAELPLKRTSMKLLPKRTRVGEAAAETHVAELLLKRMSLKLLLKRTHVAEAAAEAHVAELLPKRMSLKLLPKRMSSLSCCRNACR